MFRMVINNVLPFFRLRGFTNTKIKRLCVYVKLYILSLLPTKHLIFLKRKECPLAVVNIYLQLLLSVQWDRDCNDSCMISGMWFESFKA